jgi:transcriptional regulator with XRE-family HTH domain
MLNGAKVLRLRGKNKLTQRELAIRSDMTIQSISGIENGHRLNIMTDNLISLAKALDVEPAELLK